MFRIISSNNIPLFMASPEKSITMMMKQRKPFFNHFQTSSKIETGPGCSLDPHTS